MILRRVIKHVRNQEWTAIAIDLVIVVVGVVIGLQVSNWNQDRANHKIADSYMVRLQKDLRMEILHYGYVEDYFEKSRTHAVAALDAYAQPVDELGIDFLVDLYQASQLWNLTVRRGTYDELLASGRIGLIPNESIRSMLNNYYEGGAARKITFERNTFVPYRKTIRSLMDERVQKSIREKCGDIYTVMENNSYYLHLPDVCTISVPPDVVKAAIEELLANNEVRLELRFQLASLDTIISSIKNGLNMAETALAELEKET